jgi:hypothetical protein
VVRCLPSVGELVVRSHNLFWVEFEVLRVGTMYIRGEANLVSGLLWNTLPIMVLGGA